MEIFREEINFQSEININKLFLKADCHRINLYVSVEIKSNSDNLVLSVDNINIIFVSLNEV